MTTTRLMRAGHFAIIDLAMTASVVLNINGRCTSGGGLFLNPRLFGLRRENCSLRTAVDIVPCAAHLLFSSSAHVVAILVQNPVGDLASRAPEEFHLCIEDFREELAVWVEE